MMEKVKLGDIISQSISGEWGKEGGEIKVLRTTNFTNEGKLNLDNVVIRDIDQKKVDKKKLEKGDVIIEKSGGGPKQPVGRVVYFDEEGVFLCNNFTSVLRPRKDIVDPKYLFYQLFSNHKYGFTNTFQNKTTGIINLQLSRYIKSIKIPLPPLPEQKRIAHLLDQADQVRQLNQQLLEQYDALTQSLFLDMFGDPVRNPMGWEKVKMKDICTKITDGTHQGPKFINEGIPFLLVSNIINNEINFNTKKFISKEEYKVLTKNTPIEIGDILYTSVGSYGNPAIVKSSKLFCFQRHIAHIKPNHEIVNVYFLHAMMVSPLVKRQADRFALGAAQKTLNLKVIRRFNVFLPPLNLQNQFAQRIQQIEAQKAQAQATLAASQDLFNSLLQKAFKGELS